ncbi:MAG: hypothetical protein WCH99_09420, partial [Verrucomicrobiota bacterium]
AHGSAADHSEVHLLHKNAKFAAKRGRGQFNFESEPDPEPRSQVWSGKRGTEGVLSADFPDASWRRAPQPLSGL